MVEINPDIHTRIVKYNCKDFIMVMENILDKIYRSKKQYKSIYAIPRGGLIPGVYLSHKLGLPLYTDGVRSMNTLVVDDILDTGNTLERYTELDKVVILAKPEGIKRLNCNNIIYGSTCKDNDWIEFWWE